MISTVIDIAHVMMNIAALTIGLFLKPTHGVGIQKDGLVMCVQKGMVSVRVCLKCIDVRSFLKKSNVNIVSLVVR